MANKVMYRRRRRQSPAAHDSRFFKKDNGMEQSFFGNSQHATFFGGDHAVHRKCDNCEQEEKGAHRMEDKKDDKAVHRAEDKTEEKAVHRMEDKKEEKEVHRKGDKKDEKEVHRMDDKKEEKGVHRKEEKKEDKDVHRKAETASTPAIANASAYISSLNGKGSELPPSSKKFFQNRMGADFKDVKIHTGTQAEESAAAINAKAYTVDNHIVFGKGQFNTETNEGRKLLAHELTHVLQQSDEIKRKPVGHGHPAQPAAHTTEHPEGEFENILSGVGRQRPAPQNVTVHGGGGNISVEGRTDSNYQPSSFSVEPVMGKPARGCNNCNEVPCANVKGVMVSVFEARPTVKLPDVPEGLNACQQQKVREFIETTLTRHENQHVAAFNTYTGIVRTKFDYTGCYTSEALNDYLTPIHDKIDKDRRDAADALSKKLDPFIGHIDTDACLDHYTPPVVHHATPPPHH